MSLFRVFTESKLNLVVKDSSIYFDILPSGSKNRSVVVYISDDASNKKLQFNKNSAENLDFCNTEVLVNQP